MQRGLRIALACAALCICRLPSAADTIDYSSGFAEHHDSFMLNGSSQWVGDALQLTTVQTGVAEAGSAFYKTAVNVSKGFDAHFDFHLTDPLGQNGGGDGITFTIVATPPEGTPDPRTEVGGSGAGLGYAGIGYSIGVKFDALKNFSEPSGSTVDILAPWSNPMGGLGTGSVDLQSGHEYRASLTYSPNANGNMVLTTMLTDLATGNVWSHDWQNDTGDWITKVYLGDFSKGVGFVGFTGGTSGVGANQGIDDFYFHTPLPEPAFYQMAALIGLAGLGAFRMRRRA